VVERAEQEHDVDRAVRVVEAPRVAENGVEAPPARLLDVQWDRIHQAHVVTALGEPGGVLAGAAADVQD
jgi:hypothetical protein